MIYSDCFSLSPIRGAYQNKSLRAVKHHVVPLKTLSRAEDVVPRDERIRICGR